MLPMASRVSHQELSPAEAAVARSVLYAALFDYPLTLAQLRQTLEHVRLTPSEIVALVRGSAPLAAHIESRDGFFFPLGCAHLVDERHRRERRSRTFLSAHRPIVRLIAALPFVRMVALSGSVAYLNLEHGGDLDLFIVTRGRHVWSTAVVVILLARLLGRRRTLCANLIVADTALAFAPQDLFTASQIIGLRPVYGRDGFRAVLEANPFVRQVFPNYHGPARSPFSVGQGRLLRAVKATAEWTAAPLAALAELVSRQAYGAYLRRRAADWQSPEQVELGLDRLKLHTRSHRRDVLHRFGEAVQDNLDM